MAPAVFCTEDLQRQKENKVENTTQRMLCPTEAITFAEVPWRSIKWQMLLCPGGFLHRYKMKMLEFSKLPKTARYEAIIA